MSKNGENIYLRRDGRWEGRYICGRKSNGKPQYCSVYGYSRESVSKKLAFLREQQEIKLLSQCTVTVKDISAQWLINCRADVKVSTYERYHLLIEKHIVPELGELMIHELTGERLKVFLNEKRTRGRLDGRGGLAQKTVNDIHVLIKSIIKYAVHEYDCHVDGKLSDVKISTKGMGRGKIEVFSENETAKLTSKILENPSLPVLGYLLGLDIGMRIGEICALKCQDFDFQEGTLRIRRTVIRINHGGYTTLEIQLPKTENSKRELPLTAKHISLLKACMSDWDSDVFVFTGKPDKPLDPRTMQYRFRRFLESLDISPRGFHTLRHSFATRSIERGMDVKTLSEILGHKNVQTTMQMYVHPSIDMKRRGVELASSVA